MTDIKGKMAEEMKAAGVPEDRFQDGQLPGYMEIDLTAEDENGLLGPMAELFNKADLEEGIVLQQMMNIKSD